MGSKLTDEEIDKALSIMAENGKLALFYRMHDMGQRLWPSRIKTGIFKLEINQMVRDALRSEK